MMLGDASQPLLQIRWWRPRKRSFNAARWVRKRSRGGALRPAGGDAPIPEGFECLGYVESGQERRKRAKSVWYGFAGRAHLLIEAATGGNVSEKVSHRISRRVLPSLRVPEEGGPTEWSVFGCSFEVPAGFRVRDKRLVLGDMSLAFRARGGKRLMVRQVYPSELALARRDMPRWLDVVPFPERRRLRPLGSVESWTPECQGRILKGYRRRGWKRLPFPLGWCVPRWSSAAIVHDPDLNRLLVAEYDAPSEAGDGPLACAIAGMNRRRFEPGGGS